MKRGNPSARLLAHCNSPPPTAAEQVDSFHGLVDRATLIRAHRLAERWGVRPHEVLIANGWIDSETYYARLAERDSARLYHERNGAALLLLDGDDGRTRSGRLKTSDRLGNHDSRFVRSTSPASVRATFERMFKAMLLREAVDGLDRRYPDQSAARGIARWQIVALSTFFALWFGALWLAPNTVLQAAYLLIGACVTPVVALRLYALFTFDKATQAGPPRVPDGELPFYTVLVPMFREANVLSDLVAALARLDWPQAKLDIKLVLEASDAETVAAARALDLPGQFEIVIVPDCAPRTKPKALNYALAFARGEFLAIYDAEDRPDADQLRRAYARFRDGPPGLACVQARLGFYNTGDNWMTRQFELEYAALFDGLLPAVERLGLPMPLGGTSNHFRVSVLRRLKAWDAFNVTEDADLGVRIARHGFGCAVISSRTSEEAPTGLGAWTPQRTWLKGYMQTYAVHMRKPLQLWRELGPRRFFGFQVLFGGTFAIALLHPWCYVLAAWQLTHGQLSPATLGSLLLLLVASGIGVTGYGAAMLLAAYAVRSRAGAVSAWDVLTMPFYWLMISAASYRAVWALCRQPFYWEKTTHGVSPAPRDEVLTLH